jgi:hypothetical protein
MTQLNIVRVIVALLGVAVWGYGYRLDLANVRLAGIGILALALVLRFARRR